MNPMNNVWIVDRDMASFDHLEHIRERTGLALKVRNGRDIRRRLREYWPSLGKAGRREPFPYPPDLPPFQLVLRTDGFCPDYIRSGPDHFVSARLREVLALPEATVQYWPVELDADSDAAYAQDYQVMRLLVAQPALDLERSDYRLHEYISGNTGQPVSYILAINAFIVREDLEPEYELFCVAEYPTMLMATDTLAERVLRAGCTGMVFYTPETSQQLRASRRLLKTLDGVAKDDWEARRHRRRRRPRAATPTAAEPQ